MMYNKLLRYLCLCFCLCCMMMAIAADPQQPQQRFSPQKYQADLEKYITQQASLTPAEAAKFFPIYREMQKKQRAIYDQMRNEGRVKPANEKECKKFIQRRDQMELELKSISQSYHNKFFNVLSPSKVFDVIRAEDGFHRRMFRNWGGMPQGPQGPHRPHRRAPQNPQNKSKL